MLVLFVVVKTTATIMTDTIMRMIISLRKGEIAENLGIESA